MTESAALEATAAILIAVGACVTDIRQRRIPNLLSFGGAAAGIAYQAWSHGLTGLLTGAGGWLTGVAVFFPLFLVRGMGAGDVKLLGAIGTWLGPLDVAWAAAYTAIAGGVMALVVAAWHGRLRESVSNTGFLVWYWRHAGLSPVPGLTLEHSKGARLPYAVPILAGTAARVWLWP